VLDEILQERAACTRGHRRPRGVKKKMSNYPIRRGRICSRSVEVSVKVIR
jgi:hypothetical protein